MVLFLQMIAICEGTEGQPGGNRVCMQVWPLSFKDEHEQGVFKPRNSWNNIKHYQLAASTTQRSSWEQQQLSSKKVQAIYKQK